jgi:hypothetical protein
MSGFFEGFQKAWLDAEQRFPDQDRQIVFHPQEAFCNAGLAR